jgi:hypothetical protein
VRPGFIFVRDIIGLSVVRHNRQEVIQACGFVMSWLVAGRIAANIAFN